MVIRTLIVDNQSIVRRGLHMFLQTDAAFEIVGEAANGREALRLIEAQQPQLVLMDLLMPEMDGIDTTRSIRDRGWDLELVALSSSSDPILIRSAVLAGVSTYIHKGSRPDQLLNTLKGVVEGRVLIAPALLERLVKELPPPGRLSPLSHEEIQILRLLAAGHDTEEIASQVQRSQETIQLGLEQIQDKLACHTRLLAVLRGLQLQIIEPIPPL